MTRDAMQERLCEPDRFFAVAGEWLDRTPTT